MHSPSSTRTSPNSTLATRLGLVAGYVLRRLALLVSVLWAITTIVFFMLRLIPGGPFAASERNIPEKVRAQIRARYHLDDPLWKQYVDYLSHIVRGDLGPSMRQQGMTVNQLIAEKFPRSARLGFLSVCFAIAIGIPLGMISAYWRNRWPDKVSLGLAIIGVSVPNFVLATILMVLFVRWLRWFPSVGFPDGAGLLAQMRYLLLPSLALTGFSLAYITRLTRSSLLDVLAQDYIRTARAKGLATPVVLFKHALRNAVLPVLTYLGPLIAMTFTGSFVIEKIFSFPGLGYAFVTSIINRDYTTVLGVTIFYSAFLVTINMLIDIIYGVIDPRIQAG